jgi:hypothetical protein
MARPRGKDIFIQHLRKTNRKPMASGNIKAREYSILEPLMVVGWRWVGGGLGVGWRYARALIISQVSNPLQ